MIEFTGFTSTSLVKEKAMTFAYEYGQKLRHKGQVPVLLVMDAIHMRGFRAYLYDSRCCAFPEEKECLVG